MVGQDTQKHIVPPAVCPKQDDHIPVLCRPQLAGLLIRNRKMSDHFPDASGDHLSLLFPGFLPRLLFAPVVKQKLGLVILFSLREHRPRIECRIRIVFHAAKLLLHDTGKDKIDTFQHFFTAPEILF